MELTQGKLIILGLLLILGLGLSIASIVVSARCSKSCTSSSLQYTNPVPVSEPSNLGAGDSVGPTGPQGPPGPTLSTSFAVAYGYATFPANSTKATSIFMKGCSITRDPTYWSYTIKFDSIEGSAYSIVANAEAYNATYQGDKGSLICSVISSTMTSTSVQLRVNASGSKDTDPYAYTGATFISFMIAG